MSRLLLFLTFSFLYLTAAAQQNRFVSVSKLIQQVDIPVYAVEPSLIEARLADDSVNYRFKKSHVATSLKIGINTEYDGVWLQRNNHNIWASGLLAEGAGQLSFVFGQCEMHAGAELFVYSASGDTVAGPYTRQNVHKGILVLPFIPSDFMYIEYRVPEGQILGKLELESIGYQSEKLFKDGRFGRAGDCNADINCNNSALIKQVKQSVVRLFINGTDYCTATLVNNTAKDAHPYIFTANHCVRSSYFADRTIAGFNYESPYCNGPDGEVLDLSGLHLLATSTKLDFTLLSFEDKLNFRYKPYYAGWNASGEVPVSGYTIHHPMGDVKKISEDYDQPDIATFGAGFDENTHWMILEWDKGTTEDGSSGGPLFDRNNLLIGDLTGGDADCNDPVNDLYQMFSESYDRYPDSTEQLKVWLDPENSGTEKLEGFDPYFSAKLSADTISNIDSQAICTQAPQWGYITGHSDLGADAFAEYFRIDGVKYLLGFQVGVFKAKALNDTSEITFSIFTRDTGPYEALISKSYPVDYFTSGRSSYLEFDKAVQLEDDFYIGYSFTYTQPSDTFAVYHDGNRETANTVMVKSGDNSWQSFMDYNPKEWGTSLDIRPVLYDSIITDTFEIPEKDETFRMFPNPVCSGQFTISLHETSSRDLLLMISTVNGELLIKKDLSGRDRNYNIDVNTLANGVYFVTLFKDGSGTKQKIIVQN